MYSPIKRESVCKGHIGRGHFHKSGIQTQMLHDLLNICAQQGTDTYYSTSIQNWRNQHYCIKTSGSVYLCQINIKALGKRPHRGQVSNNQACIIIVHSIRVHPATQKTLKFYLFICKYVSKIFIYL